MPDSTCLPRRHIHPRVRHNHPICPAHRPRHRRRPARRPRRPRHRPHPRRRCLLRLHHAHLRVRRRPSRRPRHRRHPHPLAFPRPFRACRPLPTPKNRACAFLISTRCLPTFADPKAPRGFPSRHACCARGPTNSWTSPTLSRSLWPGRAVPRCTTMDSTTMDPTSRGRRSTLISIPRCPIVRIPFPRMGSTSST